MADTNKLSGGKNDSMFPQGMMTVRQMGDLLGLKKTERYWLIHKGYFKTTVIKEQIFVDIDSFEKWYANQLTYKKITGEEPGAEISKNTYSISEAAEILHDDRQHTHAHRCSTRCEIPHTHGHGRGQRTYPVPHTYRDIHNDGLPDPDYRSARRHYRCEPQAP